MLGKGERAPAFELLDQSGEPISLDALLAKGPLILYFYPADFTPVCTREACLFRDAYGELADAGLAVAGVSPDDVATHARFHEEQRLNYPLLADPEKRVIGDYGVAGPFGLVRRATFLIDPDGTIVDAVLADLRLGRHESLMRRGLRALKAGS